MTEKKKKRKVSRTTLVLVGMLAAGVVLVTYPTFADWWNSYQSRRAISGYTKYIEEMDTEEFEALREEAVEYNESLLHTPNRYHPSEEELEHYKSILNVMGNGIMGYIDIPKLRVTFPIYHTIDDAVLQRAIGHVPGTSLPVGGETTHCVLSGHRGLPSAKLFTDIDRLTEGDVFQMQILDETLTYEVDQIRTVLPFEMQDIQFEEGQDYCTLVTCTPYGVNTHRLLVRGHRIETVEDIRISADAVQMNRIYIAGAIGIIMLLAILAVWLIITRQREKEKKSSKEA